MSLLGKFGALRLRAVLIETGYTAWYRAASGSSYGVDPWAAFNAARSQRSTAKGALRLVVDLFLMGYRIQSTAVSRTFGADAIEGWKRSGLVVEAAGCLTSKYCLLSSFGKYVLLEFPSTNAGGRFIQ